MAAEQAGKEKLRIDKYLWSIRLFKTRALAAEACDKGKVRFNGNPIKPSRQVQVQDVYELKLEAKKILIQVTGLLNTRQAYTEAIKYYMDITPPDETVQTIQYQPVSFHTGKRLSKTGRPTKKQKRDLDDFMIAED